MGKRLRSLGGLVAIASPADAEPEHDPGRVGERAHYIRPHGMDDDALVTGRRNVTTTPLSRLVPGGRGVRFFFVSVQAMLPYSNRGALL